MKCEKRKIPDNIRQNTSLCYKELAEREMLQSDERSSRRVGSNRGYCGAEKIVAEHVSEIIKKNNFTKNMN